MQSGKDMKEEQRIFYQLATLITEGKNDEAKSILQNTNLHLKISDLENFTLLHVAVQSGNEDMTQHLIDSGSDVDAKTASGLSPLTLAIDRKHESILNVLLFEGNCDTKVVDFSKLTPIKANSVELHMLQMIIHKQGIDWLNETDIPSFLEMIKEVRR